MSINIRKANMHDFDSVLRLNRQFYSEAKNKPTFGDIVYLKRPTRKQMLNWFKMVLKQKKTRQATYLVACNGTEIIGHCFIRPFDSRRSETSHVGNLSIFVGKDYRNRNIGESLIRQSLKDAKGKFDIVQIVVMSINPTARHLYKKLGFRKWGTAKGYVKRKKRYIDDEYMSRWI